MHRLRKGKKEKDEGEKDSGVSGFLSGRSFKKGKNVPEPVAPVLDLASALPPTDDFRTSLLMPNLAQRFSILASEQADPKFQPKPALDGTSSNDLGSFNFSSNYNTGGLSDIAETGSLSGSIGMKAGIANAKSRDSHTSDESTGGGIMNRSRPGEGNVLFGGRQKIFRVAANSVWGSSEDIRESGSMGGRVYYDNDVPVSTFAWREKKTYDDNDDEKEDEEIQELQNQRSSSPSQHNNRNTSSSTNSTPLTRSSTAATSVNSQHPSGSGYPGHIGSPPNTMVTGKPRRQPLYEQALDQKIQEQSKLELFTNQLRRGAMSPTPMSGHSPVDGYQAQRSGASSPIAERNHFYDNSHNKPTTIATPVGGLSTFNFGLDAKSGDDANEGVGGYDDVRYHLMQKQKLLVRDHSPPRRMESPAFRVESPVQESSKRYSVSSLESDGPGGLDWNKLDMSPRSSHKGDFKPADKRQSEARSHQTFLSSLASSDESSEYEYERGDSFEKVRAGESGIGLGLQQPQGQRVVVPPSMPPSMQYEGVSRPSTAGSGGNSIASTIDQKTMGRGVNQSDGQPLTISNGNRPLSPISPHLTAKNEDSPTLPPVQGLSVLVRQHLRTDSGRSSIYAGSTYTIHSRISRQNLPDRASIAGGFKFGTNGVGKAGPANDPARPSGASGSSGGNLWEFDDWDGGYYGEDHGEPDSPTSMTHPALRKHSVASIEVTEDKGFDYGRNDKQDDDEWLRGKEQISDGSGNRTSDEDEDRGWEDELAHRKKLVQQNLREHESRSNSPVPGFASDSRPTSPGPLNILGKKTSNSMLNSEGGSKAMRMLGMGGEKHRDFRVEEERLRETVRGAKNLPMHNGSPHPQDRDFRQGPPLHMRPSQRRPPHMIPNGANRPPPHLDEHPAMRGHPPPNLQGRGPPPHGPPYGVPHGPPVAGRPPMRGPSLRGQPSREGFCEGENSPRMMSPPRNGDLRWRDDHQFDNHHGVPRSPMPHPPNPNMPGPHGTPRMGGTQRMGGPHGDGHWDGPMDRRPGAPMGPPMGRPMNGPRYTQDSREGGLPMGRGPQGGYSDDPRMLNRGPSHRMRSMNDMRDRNYDDMGRRQGPYSPEQSPPPSQMRSRGNSNAQSPPYNPILNRQRSESAIRRDGPTLPPLQTSPSRNSPALNGGLDQSTPVGRSPAPLSASTPAFQAVSTPLTPSGKSIGFPSTPNLAASSPAIPSSPASAGPAAAAYAKMQNFQQSVGPAAKKRIVDKTKISEPKLIASTSNIPTVPLPPQSPTPPLAAPGGSVAQRKRRQTATIFGGFGKNNSAEKMPSDGELEKSSFQMDEPKKEKPRGKLRKSTSDGGGLSARARREVDKNAPATPLISQAARGMI
ncbi:hypothetical protein BGX38DRAFT_495715 [Terfezia claveryi]|nr:hypothetical protein BGX38DRAFT_495715 [Terfezia claveryi]